MRCRAGGQDEHVSGRAVEPLAVPGAKIRENLGATKPPGISHGTPPEDRRRRATIDGPKDLLQSPRPGRRPGLRKAKAVDGPPEPSVESRPAVAAWLAFLADVLAAEILRDPRREADL